MYECKFSESIYDSSIGEIVTCSLNHCRCAFDGDGNNRCSDFEFNEDA